MDENQLIAAIERMETSARIALQTAAEIRDAIGRVKRPKKKVLDQKQIDGIIAKRLKGITKK